MGLARLVEIRWSEVVGIIMTDMHVTLMRCMMLVLFGRRSCDRIMGQSFKVCLFPKFHRLSGAFSIKEEGSQCPTLSFLRAELYRWRGKSRNDKRSEVHAGVSDSSSTLGGCCR